MVVTSSAIVVVPNNGSIIGNSIIITITITTTYSPTLIWSTFPFVRNIPRRRNFPREGISTYALSIQNHPPRTLPI